MTARELLAKIKKLRKAIDYRNTKIQSLIAQTEKTTSRLSGMPHNPSMDKSPMETVICKKVDLEREIEKLTDERDALIVKIDLLEDETLSKLLTLRYVDEAKWEDVMAELRYCEAHIYRLHQQAINLLDEKLKDESK